MKEHFPPKHCLTLRASLEEAPPNPPRETRALSLSATLGPPATKQHCQSSDQTLRSPTQACPAVAASGDRAPLVGRSLVRLCVGMLSWTQQPREDPTTASWLLGHMRPDVWSTVQMPAASPRVPATTGVLTVTVDAAGGPTVPAAEGAKLVLR